MDMDEYSSDGGEQRPMMRQWIVVFLTTVLIGCMPIADNFPTEIGRVSVPSATAANPLPTPASATPQVFGSYTAPTRTQQKDMTHAPSSTIPSAVSDTATEYPPLNPAGPYLFTGNTLMNADGSGMKPVVYPEGRFPHAFSPNGEWGAIFSKKPYEFNFQEPLELSLFHIPDGKEFSITDVFTPGGTDVPSVLYECSYVYINLYYIAAWSPNSRYLAFTAKTTGPSRDLFVYDTGAGIVRRLTNDDAEIVSIAWSSDSQVIYYVNGFQLNEDAVFRMFTLNAMSPESSSNRGIRTLITAPDKLEIEWIGKDYDLIVAQQRNGSCIMGGGYAGLSLWYLRYSDSTATKIFPDPFYLHIAVDPIDRMILLLPTGDEQGPPEKISIVSFDGELHSTADHALGDCFPAYLGDPKYTFLCGERSGGPVVGISLDGTLRDLDVREIQFGYIRVSPLRKWFILFDDRALQVYSRDGGLLFVWEYEPPLTSFEAWMFNIVWPPDGKGFFIALENNRIVYFSFVDPIAKPIFHCPGETHCIPRLMWAEWAPQTGA
jgi:hypothetical protein